MSTPASQAKELLDSVQAATTSLKSARDEEVLHEAAILKRTIAAVKAVRLSRQQKDRSTVILREAAQVLARRLLIDRARAGACFRLVGIDAEGVGVICGADAGGGTRAGWPCCRACQVDLQRAWVGGMYLPR